jgi:hypothetical protein
MTTFDDAVLFDSGRKQITLLIGVGFSTRVCLSVRSTLLVSDNDSVDLPFYRGIDAIGITISEKGHRRHRTSPDFTV